MEETLRLRHSQTVTDQELGMGPDAMEYLTAIINVASGVVGDDPVH